MLIATNDITLKNIPSKEHPNEDGYYSHVFIMGEKTPHIIEGTFLHYCFKFNDLFVLILDPCGWDYMNGYVRILDKSGKTLESIDIFSNSDLPAIRLVETEGDILKINLGDMNLLRGEIDIEIKVIEKPLSLRRIRTNFFYRFFLGYRIAFEKWLPWHKSRFQLLGIRYTCKRKISLIENTENN